jgi:hypothetical protein
MTTKKWAVLSQFQVFDSTANHMVCLGLLERIEFYNRERRDGRETKRWKNALGFEFVVCNELDSPGHKAQLEAGTQVNEGDNLLQRKRYSIFPVKLKRVLKEKC